MKYLKVVILLLSLVYLILSLIYFEAGDKIISMEKLAQFGDFIGGLLNPILSIVTLIVVLYSLLESKRDEKLRALNSEFEFFRYKRDSIKLYKGENVIDGSDVFSEFTIMLKKSYVNNALQKYLLHIAFKRPLSELEDEEKNFILKHVLRVSESNYQNIINDIFGGLTDLEAISKANKLIINDDNATEAYLFVHYVTEKYKKNGAYYNNWNNSINMALMFDSCDIASYTDSLTGLFNYINELNDELKQFAIKRLYYEVSNNECVLLYFLIVGKYLPESFTISWELAGLHRKLKATDVCQLYRHWYITEKDVDELYKISKKVPWKPARVLIST